jgi:hypothetical protein
VQGAVVLTVVKPVRITHLTVSLHGYVRVYKGPTIPSGDPIINPSEPPTASRTTRLKLGGHGHASLFHDEQVLSSDGRLEPGRYEFNFDLLFPVKTLPSSIDVCSTGAFPQGLRALCFVLGTDHQSSSNAAPFPT